MVLGAVCGRVGTIWVLEGWGMGERLTKRVIDAAQPTGRDTFLFDTDIKGFALKITAGGKKVFTYQGRVAGEKIRVTIGPYGAFTCDQARAEAEKLRALFARGLRPGDLERAAEANAEQRRQEDEARRYRAFSSVAERYFAARVRKQARGKPVEALIQNVFVDRWQGRDIATIARRDVAAVVDEIVADGRPGAAREALKRIRPLFAFAVEKDDIAINPAEGIRLDDKYVPRDRVLTDAELVEVWRAAETLGYPFGSMVQLLILTGQRLREVAEAPWSEIDLKAGLWAIAAARSKNRKAHIVHISPQAEKIIEAARQHQTEAKDAEGNRRYTDCAYVLSTTGKTPISGFSKCKAHIDAAIAEARAKTAGKPVEDMMPWTLHDLRRTFATAGARLGIASHVIEKVLNHNPAALKGVAGIYNRFEYLPERKAALEIWGQYVEQLTVGGAMASNVVPLRG